MTDNEQAVHDAMTEAQALGGGSSEPEQHPGTQQAEHPDRFTQRQDKSLGNIMGAWEDKYPAMNDDSPWSITNEQRDQLLSAAKAFEQISTSITQTASDAFKLLKDVSIPTFEIGIPLESMNAIVAILREWTRKNAVLVAMIRRWDAVNGDSDNEPDASDLTEALQYIALAFSAAHGDDGSILADDDDGGTYLLPDIEAAVNQTVDDFIKAHKARGTRAKSYLTTARSYVKKAFPDYDAGESTTALIHPARIRELAYPLDKVDGTIWKLAEGDYGGQIGIRTGKAKGGDVMLLVNVSFDDLLTDGVKITRSLNQYEKRVYIAAGGLYGAQNGQPFTLTDVYRAMGGIGRPSKRNLEAINDAITKMAGSTLFIDNASEVAAKYNYPPFRYDGKLLPMERVTQYAANGELTEAAIHLLREPPLITFAKQRKQITQINLGILQSPLNMTESNLALEDYMMERIAHLKDERRAAEKNLLKLIDSRGRKKPDDEAEALEKQIDARKKELARKPCILLGTLYSHAGIKTKMQRQRAPEKIARILDHYKAQGFIGGYKLTSAKIELEFGTR